MKEAFFLVTPEVLGSVLASLPEDATLVSVEYFEHAGVDAVVRIRSSRLREADPDEDPPQIHPVVTENEPYTWNFYPEG